MHFPLGKIQLLIHIFTDAPWYQVGIVSYGPKKCGQEDRPGVYTRVASFVDWIAEKMKEQNVWSEFQIYKYF